MKHEADNPFDALERIFHEPNRLAIMSALCAAEDGLSFNALKTVCGLTDGNLNRHLKVLQDAKAVRKKKAFVKDKPRTTVYISEQGLDRFNEYLSALSDVLTAAKNALPVEKKVAAVPLGQHITI